MTKNKNPSDFTKAETVLIDIIDFFKNQKSLEQKLIDHIKECLGPAYSIEHNNNLPPGVYDVVNMNYVSVAYIWYDENLNPVLTFKPAANYNHFSN
jgi:hypothetical protein